MRGVRGWDGGGGVARGVREVARRRAHRCSRRGWNNARVKRGWRRVEMVELDEERCECDIEFAPGDVPVIDNVRPLDRKPFARSVTKFMKVSRTSRGIIGKAAACVAARRWTGWWTPCSAPCSEHVRFSPGAAARFRCGNGRTDSRTLVLFSLLLCPLQGISTYSILCTMEQSHCLW